MLLKNYSFFFQKPQPIFATTLKIFTVEKNKFNLNFVLGITLISALGGLLFGYDWVVIGGAKPFYERFFSISDIPALQGWAMSSALIGCLMGAGVSGYFSDLFGRKLPLIFAAALFTISAIGTGATNDFNLFILFRIVGGIGIGLASAISPIYIAEIAPAKYRGRLVSINQLTIVIGILLAQIVNYLIAERVPANASDSMILNSWNGQMGWRFMFWAETVPALFFFIFVFFIPESPRFLLTAKKTDQAEKLLNKIGGQKYAKNETTNINATLSADKTRLDWKFIRSKKIAIPLAIGIVLAVFQQWSGINVIFNYAEEIFTSAGYTVSDMLFNIVITGTVNLIFTLIAMRTVDKWGRRKLLLFGSIALSAIYILIGSCYYFKIQGIMVLSLVILAIAVYAMTLAPVIWVVLSEIFPNKVRGIAMAIATTALWAACFVLTYTFPILNDLLNASGTFWLYSLICFAGFVFIWLKLPETKGKSLEEVEEFFESQQNKKIVLDYES